MNYLLLSLSIIISIISIRGVIKRYNDQSSFKNLQMYQTDVLGMVVGIALFVVSILRIIGYDIK